MRYGKVLKSKNIQEKYDYAVMYFEKGECYKALPIFDELVGLVRGTALYEDVYYYYAKTNFCIEDYYLANYYSKNFAKTFTTSPRAEELMFLSAMSSYNNSPKSSLDQRDTKAALDEFQYFLDNYPNSNLKDSCENMMLRLSYKLEKKNFDIVELYVKTEKYKSATIALDDMLQRYPDSQFREQLFYLKIEAWYEYAEASVDSKKEARYRECVTNYNTFISTYPKSDKSPYAESYYLRAYDKLKILAETKDQSYLEKLNSELRAEGTLLDKEESIYKLQDFYRSFEKEALDIAEVHVSHGNYEYAIRQLEKIEKDFEYPNYPLKTTYLLFKSWYDYAASSPNDKKQERYKECIKSYSTFVSDFPESTYIDEAGKLHKKASHELELLENELRSK